MKKVLSVAVIGLWLVFATAAQANVFDMGGTRNADGSWTGSASLETVPVGDPGNAGELSAGDSCIARICGAVGYEYRIGKYDVTQGQYTEFLNAVAKTDTYGLYNVNMAQLDYGSRITQNDANGDGLWEYFVSPFLRNRPVNFVNWGDAARFANWLHNGQPTGAQDLSTTEDGSYTLNGAMSDAALLAVTRKPNATWVIPSEDEWYKAAYYKGGGTNAGYFGYPTSSDTEPGQDMADASGNNANYSAGYWGTYTTVVGQFRNSASPYGTFDQAGNVDEWNEAFVNGPYRGMRGGSYWGTPVNVLHASFRGNAQSTAECDFLGFRVVEVPEPASTAIFALGGLALLRRRKA